MSVCLDYVCAAPVPETLRLLLTQEAAQLQHNWWAEAISLYADDNCLAGSSKLFLIGYHNAEGDYREIDPEDDSLMAWRDASFIVQTLKRWSAEHDLSWQLSCAGEEVGLIAHGQLDQSGREFLESLLEILEIPQDKLPARMEYLDAHFGDR